MKKWIKVAWRTEDKLKLQDPIHAYSCGCDARLYVDTRDKQHCPGCGKYMYYLGQPEGETVGGLMA